MATNILFVVLLCIVVAAFMFARNKATKIANGAETRKNALHSLPNYYGLYTALWAGIPALILLVLWISFESSFINRQVISELPQGESPLLLNSIKNIGGNLTALESLEKGTDEFSTLSKKIDAANAEVPNVDMVKMAESYNAKVSTSSYIKTALVVALACLGAFFALNKIAANFRARNRVDNTVKYILMACSIVAIFTTVGIVLSVMFESLLFFRKIPFTDFLFGTHWSPSSETFGMIPLLVGTLLISLIAMIVAVPIGLMTAIYLAEYADSRFRAFAKPVLELLAGIPTVVYGFFAALTVAPAFVQFFGWLGIKTASESALAAGVVMGVMIIPFVSSLSDDVITAVPDRLRDGSLGMGATKSETIKKVVLPAALPGIVGSILLAVSRAIGETMIVVMAAGLAANLTVNPFDAVTTITVQIATLLVGDQEFDSAKTLAAFALALLLFVVTLGLNIIALRVVKKYREQYD